MTELRVVAEAIRQAAPEHYMCNGGLGCPRCTYDHIADRIDPAVTCTCEPWRALQTGDVPHHPDCKVNTGPLIAP